MTEEKNSPFKPNPKYYEYIRFGRWDLWPLFRCAVDALKVHGRDDVNFLDVGCGIGNVLLYFQAFVDLSVPAYMGLHSSPVGIEYDPTLAIAARKLGLDVHNMDAFDYEHYNKADIIYYYHPIRDEELQKKLEIKIEDDAKAGAIFIAPLRRTKLRKGFTILNGARPNSWDGKFDGYSRAVVYRKDKKSSTPSKE